MNFAYRQQAMQNPDLQYLQAVAMLNMQQKLKASLLPVQMQQNMLLANLLRHREAMEISRAEQNLKRMLALNNVMQNQR